MQPSYNLDLQLLRLPFNDVFTKNPRILPGKKRSKYLQLTAVVGLRVSDYIFKSMIAKKYYINELASRYPYILFPASVHL